MNVPLGGTALNWLGEPRLALARRDRGRRVAHDALRRTALLRAALKIPPELYEAAEIDGAGPLGPSAPDHPASAAPDLLIALLFRTLDALRAFDVMFVLTGGGPANTTETLTVYAYRSLFQTLQIGLGSAIGVTVFGLVMLTAWGYLTSSVARGWPRDERPRRGRAPAAAVLDALLLLNTRCRSSGSS